MAGVDSDSETLLHVWAVVIDEGNPNVHCEARDVTEVLGAAHVHRRWGRRRVKTPGCDATPASLQNWREGNCS